MLATEANYLSGCMKRTRDRSNAHSCVKGAVWPVSRGEVKLIGSKPIPLLLVYHFRSLKTSIHVMYKYNFVEFPVRTQYIKTGASQRCDMLRVGVIEHFF